MPVRYIIYTVLYFLGITVAYIAAATGSIGPEPPRSLIGTILATIYYPYFMTFCVPLGGAGFIIALVLSGMPFVWLGWVFFRLIPKNPKKDVT